MIGQYEQLKADIAEVIRENGRQEITGDILQQVLLGMVGELGGGATFAGIAEPQPRAEALTPDNDVFYFAFDKGVYGQFGGLTVDNNGSLNVVYIKDGEWTLTAYGEQEVRVTYSELMTLLQSARLTSGNVYRITDYECTTITPGTQSAGHQFDIVVQAIDVDTLSEDAEAMLHDGDTYFELCDLRRWELKYTVFNDVSRYAWADSENGKGVVYWMKDEFGNECGYDFKNIQFLRFNTWDDEQQKNIGYYAWTGVTDELPGDGRFQVKDNTDRKFMYTFMRGGSERDASVPYAEMPSVVLSVNCVIAENWLQPRYPLRLNNIVFLNQPRNVKTGAESYNSTVGGSGNVTIGTGFQGNIIGVSSHDFVIGNAFAGNYVGELVVSTIGDNCHSNTIDKLSGCKVGTAFNWNILKECTECDFHNVVEYLSAEGNLNNVEVLTGVSSEQLQVEGNGNNVVGVDSNGAVKVWKPAERGLAVVEIEGATTYTLNAVVGKYYRFEQAEVLNLVLPVPDSTEVASVVLGVPFSGGASLTVTSEADVRYQDGFEIEEMTNYEINCLWNGLRWVVAAMKIAEE